MKIVKTPITELLSFVVDNRGKTVPTAESGTPLIATNCIKHESIYPTFENIRYVDDKTMNTWFRAHPQPNDIIFVNKGTPGRVCLVPDPVTFCFAQDMMGFRCDPEKIDYKYLFAVLRSNYIQERIRNFHVGLVIPHFKKGDLKHLEIPRLDTKELESAVGELYISLSKKIEINNKINNELEAMAKTLYDYWFVQFDFPDQNGKPYKSSGGKMVYNEVLKREIPEGWKVKPVDSIIEVKDGTHDSPKPSDVGEYLITSKHLQPTGIDFSTAYRISFEDYEEVNKRSKVDEGDFLFSMIGTIGITHWVKKITTPFAIKNMGLFKTSKKPEWADYIYSSITSEYSKAFIAQNQSSGTSRGFVTLGLLRSIPIVMPSDKVHSLYTQKVRTLYTAIANNSEQNNHLEELRDWLLPMLMNGQVTVKL